jgi:hypothetical protein
MHIGRTMEARRKTLGGEGSPAIGVITEAIDAVAGTSADANGRSCTVRTSAIGTPLPARRPRSSWPSVACSGRIRAPDVLARRCATAVPSTAAV